MVSTASYRGILQAGGLLVSQHFSPCPKLSPSCSKTVLALVTRPGEERGIGYGTTSAANSIPLLGDGPIHQSSSKLGSLEPSGYLCLRTHFKWIHYALLTLVSLKYCNLTLRLSCFFTQEQCFSQLQHAHTQKKPI